ncbi:MAG: four helix bundle protein [Candidatus Gracilibacteria bacterium]|nr:four helix bundle protein [Candidatus Gracilibacteria bacterium]
MRILRFEELESWKKSQQLAKLLYKELASCRDFSFRDQIQRAGVSISNNIAEGFERQTNKELKQFLYIAKGSCGEFRSMLYLAKDLSYISEERFTESYNLSIEISKLLSAFIKKVGE